MLVDTLFYMDAAEEAAHYEHAACHRGMEVYDV